MSASTSTALSAPFVPPNGPWVGIVGNPYSGHGANQKRVSRLVDELVRLGMTALILWDPAQRDAMLDHPLLAQTCRCIVVAGGDGTIGDVLNHRPSVALAILPLGNENLLAKHLGFTRDVNALAAAIVRGRTRELDVGVAGGRRFSLMLTAGLDADIVHHVADWRSGGGTMRRVRHWSYVSPALTSLRTYPFPSVSVNADGKELLGTLAMVFNLPRYGLSIPFAPDAVGDDGLLDYVVFRKPGVVSAVDLLFSVMQKKHHRRADVFTGRAKRIQISSIVPVPIQVDGDPAGFTPMDVGVLPGTLRVVEM